MKEERMKRRKEGRKEGYAKKPIFPNTRKEERKDYKESKK